MAAVADVRQAEARHPHHPVDVRLDHPLLVVLARLPERVAADRTAGVVDEDVQPAERLDRGLDERARAAGVGDVELVREVPFEAVDAPGPDGDLDALASRRAPAVAAPIPLEAPVTIAVFPSRLIAGTATESIAGAASGGGTSGRSARGPRACSTWSVECSSPNSSARRCSSRARIAWQSAPGATRTCAESDRKAVRQRPDVQVVHLGDLGLLAQRTADGVGLDVCRRDLEEDARRLAKQPVRAPEHEPGDEETCDRVEAIPAR